MTSIREDIDALPGILAEAYASVADGFGGTTADMMRASYFITDVLQNMLVKLSNRFPVNHFGGGDPAPFFADMVRQRFEWRRALAEPEGAGTGGTIVGPLTAAAVINDLIVAVEDMVEALTGRGIEPAAVETAKAWKMRWHRARIPQTES